MAAKPLHPVYSLTPRPAGPPLRWRRLLLVAFGARIHADAIVYGSARVWYPPNLSMGARACIGPRVNCYCMAPIHLGDGAIVSARPSDAIAVALRTGSPILVDDAVLDEAGVVIPDEEEDEVERFREFLDQVTPEDFGAES